MGDLAEEAPEVSVTQKRSGLLLSGLLIGLLLLGLATWTSAAHSANLWDRPVATSTSERAGTAYSATSGAGGRIGSLAFRGYVTRGNIPLRYLEPSDIGSDLDSL